MFEVTISIGLKKGVSDPEAENTLKSLHLLGFEKIKKVKTTKVFTLLMGEKDKKKVRKETEEMCKKLLTNPVIHEYSISIKEQ